MSSDLSSRHRGTLEALFAEPTRAGIAWDDVVALLRALGAEHAQGRGSRERFTLNGVRMVLHRPHPRKELGRAAVRDVRDLLMHAGIEP